MAVICKPLAEYKDTILNTGIRLECDDIPKKPVKRLIRFFKTIEDKRMENKIDYPLTTAYTNIVWTGRNPPGQAGAKMQPRRSVTFTHCMFTTYLTGYASCRK